MPESTYVQSSFLGGEVSKRVQGRTDLPSYRTWMNVCLNGFPIETGTWVRRPGTKFAGTTRLGAAGRLIKFDFKENSPYNMEFTDGYLRLFNSDTVAKTNDAQVVASISTANPAKVATALAHGWVTGNRVRFDTLGNTAAIIQNREFVITVTSTTEFTIADGITGANIDGATILPAYVSGANVSRILEIVTPYTLGGWSTLRSVQTETSAVLLNGPIRPQVLNAVPAAGNIFATFSLTPADFIDGPYLDPINGSQVTSSGLTGVVSLTLSFAAYSATVAYSIGDFVTSGGISYKSLTQANLNNTPAGSPTNWVVVNAGAAVGPAGFVASDIGRLVRLFSEPDLYNPAAGYTINQVVAYNNQYWTAAGTIAAGVAPGTSLSWSIAPAGARWTWGQVLSISASGLINPALAGSVNVGTMTAFGGLAAAFDGVTSKPTSTACAYTATIPSAFYGGVYGFAAYVGKNYSGASAQIVDFVTLYPTSNNGFGIGNFTPFGTLRQPDVMTFNLRAKQTAPANSSDGIVLGTVSTVGSSTAPISIPSSDKTTAWNYVWVEIGAQWTDPFVGTEQLDINIAVSQLQIFAPNVANGTVVSFQIRGPALLYANTIRTWRLGAYSDTTGWPKCGTYHEGRLWLSGAIPNRFDGSRALANNILDFSPTLPDGTVVDSSAISYTVAASDVNAIFWMIQDLQGIILGTQAGEWLVQASTLNSPLSPLNIQAHRVTKIGCANIEPRRTDHTIVFVQKFRRKIMEFFADVYSGKFTAPHLSFTGKHLTLGGVDEIAYQQELSPTVWSRVAGALIGCTYKRDTLATSQGPTIAGWHRHTLGSGRLAESLCVGPSTDGNLDSLSMVTNDVATSVRHVEIMTDILDEGVAAAAAWYLDDAIIPSSAVHSATPFTNAPYGGLTLNGLWHLNGKTVTVFAGGIDCSDFLVTNGSISVPYGDGISAGTGSGLFTAAFAASGIQIVVGFTYTSDGQIVRPATPAESGARNGPAFAKLKRTDNYGILVDNTAGMKIGTTFDKLFPISFKSPSGRLPAVGATFSGIYRDSVQDDVTFDSMLCWRSTRPYPANVIAIGAFIDTTDA